MRRMAVVAMVVMLANCAGGEREYTGPETAGGASVNVAPENYRAEILAYQRSYLNDPSGIRSAAISQPALRKVANVERYVACVRFDAKGPAGAYSGVRDHICDLPCRQARPADPDARAVQGRDLRAVPGTGAAEAITRRNTVRPWRLPEPHRAAVASRPWRVASRAGSPDRAICGTRCGDRAGSPWRSVSLSPRYRTRSKPCPFS